MHRSFATLVVALLLFGCVARGDRPIRVQVDGDEFSKDITVSGVTSTYNPFGGDVRGFWYLRSFANPEAHKVEHQLYFEISYGGGLNGAYYAADNSAQPHPIHLLYRDYCYWRDEVLKSGCVHRDYLGIDISDETLRAKAMQGMEIKVSARSGFSLILPISTLMITAQLDAIEQINSGRVVVGKTVKSGGTINVLSPGSVNDGTGSTPAQVAR